MSYKALKRVVDNFDNFICLYFSSFFWPDSKLPSDDCFPAFPASPVNRFRNLPFTMTKFDYVTSRLFFVWDVRLGNGQGWRLWLQNCHCRTMVQTIYCIFTYLKKTLKLHYRWYVYINDSCIQDSQMIADYKIINLVSQIYWELSLFIKSLWRYAYPKKNNLSNLANIF